MKREPRFDCTLLGCDRHAKIYSILGSEGEWHYSHETGQVNKRYHFWRIGKRDPNRRINLDLSYDQVQAKLFEITPHMMTKLDLSQLEGFRGL